MIDLILVVLFCYQMNRMAHDRGIASLPYILHYLAIFFLVMLVGVFTLFSFFGSEALKTEQGIKAAMMFEPFAIMFEVFLFIYFRKRIQKTLVVDSGNDDFIPPSPPSKNDKKDLSYFR